MIVKVADLHFAFGMKWIISHDKKETRLIKAQFNPKGSLFVCQEKIKAEIAPNGQAWLGVYTLSSKSLALREPKPIYCAALCLATFVRDAILVQPLMEGCVWFCVIKDGLPVVGFDLLLSPDEIESHVDYCQRVFMTTAEGLQPDTPLIPRSFEVIEPLELLRGIGTEKSKDRALAKSIKAARLRPLEQMGWRKFRPIVLTLSAGVVLSVLCGVAAGEGFFAIFNGTVDFGGLSSSTPVRSAVDKVHTWVSTAFFPEHARQESIRLQSLALQRQESNKAGTRERAQAQLKARQRQYELNEGRFLDQQNLLRSKVQAIELWQEFNRVRQSVPISWKGREMRHIKCVLTQCDLNGSTGIGEMDRALLQVSLNVHGSPMELGSQDSAEGLLESLKIHFDPLPVNWSTASPNRYLMQTLESAVPLVA